MPASQDLLRMCEDRETCRRDFILGHHGLPPKGFCGNCDNCDRIESDSNLVMVSKKLFDRAIAEFKSISQKTSIQEHKGMAKVSINGLAEVLANMPAKAFRSMLNIDSDDMRAVRSRRSRKKILQTIIQNLILQGVFIEYPVKVMGQKYEHFKFYLKVSR